LKQAKEFDNVQKNWRKALLPVNANLQEAIRALEEAVLQIILVVTPV
jgi:hypothetical protein